MTDIHDQKLYVMWT